MSSIKRVIGLGLVASAMLASGLALASNHCDGYDKKSGERSGKMQQRMDKRMAELKATLAITAAQEGAWSDFQAAMKPAEKVTKDNDAKRAKHDAMKAMTTPERLDARYAMMMQRNTQMTARSDAIRAFYAQLSPTQQTVFDDASVEMMGGKKGNKHSSDRGDSCGH